MKKSRIREESGFLYNMVYMNMQQTNWGIGRDI